MSEPGDRGESCEILSSGYNTGYTIMIKQLWKMLAWIFKRLGQCSQYNQYSQSQIREEPVHPLFSELLVDYGAHTVFSCHGLMNSPCSSEQQKIQCHTHTVLAKLSGVQKKKKAKYSKCEKRIWGGEQYLVGNKKGWG